MDNLHIPITGDNTGFVKALNDAREKVKSTARDIERSGVIIEDMFARIKQAAAISLAGFSAKEFIQKVVAVRGEFQQLEVAFKTMLGNAEKANELMQQLTRTAAATPFDLQGVTNGAKQLLAYGIAAEDVNSTLIHLGDIAAGLSLPLTDLVYLYGTTMVQGRMFTQDLRQFQNRGIPIAEELSKVLGVTKDKVGELITAGKVGAKEFNQAIMAMSSEGGKFGGLMEAQSKTITGQISNIEDAIDVMFNNIGKQSEGITNGTLSVVSSLVENYETVGKVIASTIAVYGTYKAAVMAVCAAQSLQAAGIGALTAKEAIHYGWLVMTQKAQSLLNKTMLTNPYVLVAAAVATVAVALWNMKSKQEMVKEATEEYNKKKDEAIRKEEEHANKIRELTNIAGDESLSTENRREALIRLEQQYPSVFERYDTEAEKLEHIRDIKNEIAILDGKKSITNPQNELSSVNSRIAELERKVGTVQTYSTSAGSYSVTVGGRTNEEDAELIALKRRREQLNKEIKKEEANEYLKNLTGISNDELQRQINVRKNLLARMRLEQKKYGEVKSGGATGVFTEDELQGQLQIMQSELNKRNEAKVTPAQQKKALKEQWEKAKKALDEFDKSSTQYTAAEAEEARKKLEEAVQDAEKKYKAFGGSVSADKSAAEQESKKKRDYALLKELQDKQALESERAAKDMEFSTTQATIDAMEEGTQKKAAQIMLDYAKQKEELKRGYEDLKQTKIDNAKKVFEANPANKDKVFDPLSISTDYTDAEIENFRQLNEAADKEYARHLREIQEEERRYRLDFLKEYGSYEEQRLAIAEEYDRKIAEADNEWAKKSLEEQKKAALSEVKLAEVKFSIDWGAVFGRITSITTEKLEEQKQLLLSLSNSGEITDINQIRELQEALSAIMDELASRHGGVFAIRTAYNDLNKAQKGVIDAEVKLTQARMAGSQEAIRASEKELELAREREKTARKSVDSAKKATADFINAITDFDFTSFSGVFTGLKNVAPAFDAMFKTNIQGIFNELGDEMTAALGKLGDMVMSTVQNIGKLIDCGGGSRDTYVRDMLEKFDALSTSIDNLAKKIEEGTIDEAIGAYEQQLEMLKEQMASAQDTLKSAMDMSEYNCEGCSCGDYVHNFDSVNTELGKRLNADDWNAIGRLLGIDINKASQLWDLSPEQMYAIQTYLPNVMTKIKNAISDVGGQSDHGKEAADEALRILESYIGLAGKEGELQVKIAFRVTGLSFDELKENFRSTLKDIKSDVEDFSEDVSEMLANALLDAEFSKAGGINQKLEAWYDRLMQLFYNRSSMSSEEFNSQLSSLRTDYEKYAAEAIAARNWANELAGVDADKYEQEASAKGFQAMSQDTADELNGRFTALQICGEAISANIISMLETLNSMSDTESGRNEVIEEIRNMIQAANGHLEDVAKYSKKIYNEFGERLERIETNTNRL